MQSLLTNHSAESIFICCAKNNFLELVSLNISNYSIKKLATIDYYGYSKQGVVHIPILNHVFAEKVKAKKHN